MKKQLAFALLVIAMGIAAEVSPWIGDAYVLGEADPRDYNDPQTNERLTEALANCLNSGTCPIDGEFIVHNEYTIELGVFTWTGSGWRDVFGRVFGPPCGPIDCGDPPPGDFQGY
jgi:hypothetical protein